MKSSSCKYFVLFYIFFFVLFIFPHTTNAEWKNVDSEVSTDLNDVVFADEFHGWAVGDSSTILVTIDGGRTWNRQTSPIKNIELEKVYFVNDSVGYIIGYPSTLLSTKDGGDSWVISDVFDGHFLHAACFIDEHKGWLTGYTGGHDRWGAIFHSNDGGEKWEKQYDTSSLFFEKDIFTGISFIDENNGWVLGGGYEDNFNHTNIYRTYDSGKSWKKISSVESPRYEIRVVSPDTVWAYSSGFARSINGGLNWETSGRDIPGLPGNCKDICTIEGQNGWGICYDVNLKRSYIISTNNGGSSWEESFSSNKYHFNAITYAERDIICVVGSDGLIMTHINKANNIDVSINNYPESFHLIGNYPNPFNSNTTISFSLLKSSQVKLNIYSITGQKITTLVDGFMSMGEHTAQFDGGGLSSGMYFYRFEAGDVVKTGRMTLVK